MISPRPSTTVHLDSSHRKIMRCDEGTMRTIDDQVAVESPLEIRLVHHDESGEFETPISVTMRTPGHVGELATGFLLTEGIIDDPEQIERIRMCGGGNVIIVHLKSTVIVDTDKLTRHFYTSSSCGVCGKSAIEAVNVSIRSELDPNAPRVKAAVISSLPQDLRSAQSVFDRTGGLHASGLFDTSGSLIRLHEDVGRHNALDKLIGAQWYDDESVLAESIVLVSGRVSFELVQKALVAGVAILVAVGAPSSLAVDLASHHNMTLVGFNRGQRFNLYSGFQRVELI